MPSATPPAPANNSHPQLQTFSDSSTDTSNLMHSTPADASNLSPYSFYHTNSNFGTPSTFDTLSDNDGGGGGGYSELSYNGQDEFWGVSFDDTDPDDLDSNLPLMNSTSIALPTSCRPSEIVAPSGPTSAPTSAPMSVAIHPHPTRLHIPSLPDIHSTLAMDSNQGPGRSLSIPVAANANYAAAAGRKRPGMTSNESNSSHGSNGCISPNALALPHSPRVQITHWGSGVVRDLPDESDVEDEAYGGNRATTFETNHVPSSMAQHHEEHDPMSPEVSQFPSFAPLEDQYDADEDNTSRRGVAPERRKSMSEAEVANFKDQDRNNELEAKLSMVEEWNSQVGGDSDEEEDVTPTEHRSSLAAPRLPRQRSHSTGAPINRAGFDPDFRFPDFPPSPQKSKDPDEGKGIEPVDDAASIRENRYQDGQSYFNVRAREMTPKDRLILSQSRAFHDGVSYHKAVDTRTQPDTANAAIAKYNEQAETYSILSRSATWGTRRRSEPSIADAESIRNGHGGLIKRFSFGRDKKEKKPSIFQETRERVSSIVRKKSDAKPKRGREPSIPTTRKESQSSLAPPRATSRPRPQSPHIDTNVGPGNLRRQQSGSGSIGPSSPNRNVFGGIGNAIKRVRSRSDVSRKPEEQGLYGMIRAAGGPPAPIPSLPMETTADEENKAADNSDLDLEDDDDDDFADDGEREDLDESVIVPNFLGFHDHVLRLNPEMGDKEQYLVDRIAHQQVVRYKALLGWGVKHAAAVSTRSCNSGNQCIRLGGLPSYSKSKGQTKNGGTASNGFADVSDGDSNPEGKLATESFPVGVPMPPATSLPATFECQLCFKVKAFQKPSDWTKHVHEDVQPFTCTYPGCREPKSFKRKADWVRHENERHRHLEWWTCQVDDCQHKCFRKDNFLQHLVREHKMTEPKQKTKAAIKKAKGSEEQIWTMIKQCHHETTMRPQDEPCKFCGKVLTSWKKLTVHLAKHMEHISLPVLRLVAQKEVSSDTIISPVEPPPVRQTPLTPVGMDRQQGLSAHSGHSGHSGNFNTMGSHNITPTFPQNSPFGSSPIYNSPNGQGRPYPEYITGQPSMFNSMPSNQNMNYHIHAPVPQHNQQHDFILDNGGIPYDPYNSIDTSLGNNIAQSQRAYTPMEQSPLLGQQHNVQAFAGGNQFSNNSLSPQDNSGYSISPRHVSGEPNYVTSNQQHNQLAHFQMQNANRQSLTPDPINFVPISDAQSMNVGGFTSNGGNGMSNNVNMGGMVDNGGAFNFQGLQQNLDAGLGMSFPTAGFVNGPQQRPRGASGASLGANDYLGNQMGGNAHAAFSQMGRGNIRHGRGGYNQQNHMNL